MDRHALRHSTSHVMAAAVLRLFPEAKLAIGPAIETGFYYDFDLPRPLTPEDLVSVEREMRAQVGQDLPFEQEAWSKERARAFFGERGQTYKLELIADIEGDEVSIYRHGEFTDLCAGPHVERTGLLSHFKLLKLAGAYWRGDENKAMLQRIYGTVFESSEALEEHLHQLEEAERRDHRRLGKDLEIFSLNSEVGGGLIFWHPAGATILDTIEGYWKERHVQGGYELVRTPHIARGHLWQTSGHFDFYKENMFLLPVDQDEYVLKPMNCPGHILIFQSRRRSYRELPIRFAELGTVYRYERAGTLHGLLRVRGFTQDDAHIFCTPEQLPEEVVGVLDLALEMLNTFGFDKFDVELSVRDPQNPQKYAGTDEEWQQAEASLVGALEKRNVSFTRVEGEAVFYGPKIDIKLVDALGRKWQATTIQFDFNLPRRFGVHYIGTDSAEHPLFMVHRAILGSLERFVGTLLEHYGGALPPWLAPVAARVINVTDDQAEYAKEVRDRLRQAGIRAEADLRNEKVGYKIRDAEVQKLCYMLIVGKREVANRTVSLRARKAGDLGARPLDEAVAEIQGAVKDKVIL